MKKKWIAAIGILAVVLIGAGTAVLLAMRKETVYVQGDYPYYEALEEMSERASAVVRGTVVGIEQRMIDISLEDPSEDSYISAGGESEPLILPYTVYTIQINEPLKGIPEGQETLEVKVMGGTDGNTEYVPDETVQMEEGGQYVLFLETYDGLPASLLNMRQADYECDGNGEIAAAQARNAEEGKFVFTLDELREVMNTTESVKIE